MYLYVTNVTLCDTSIGIYRCRGALDPEFC